MFRRIARIAGLCAFTTILAPSTFVSAAGARQPKSQGVTAARPGVPLVASGRRMASQGAAPRSVRRSVTTGEGAGESFCSNEGGQPLGASLDNVYACGPATGTPDDFDTAGFQCVELSVRYLWVTQGKYVSDVPDGADMVSDAHTQYGWSVGTPGLNSLPAPGDIVSLSGGPNALVWGHTAVVTSVDVNSEGNGTIGIMEENGSNDGTDQINVTDWSEAYGDPNFEGGEYYYDNIEWLELQPSIVPTPPPPATTPVFAVRGFGAGSVARAVNDEGTVAGVFDQKQGNEWIDQPFLFTNGSWRHPGSPSTSTAVTGVNDHGAVTASAGPTKSYSLGYALHTEKGFQWSKLPRLGPSQTANHTTSIDAAGDVSGWQGDPGSNGSAMGVVWVHAHGRYHIRKLAANRYFSDPVVTDTDHWGDAIGTEMLGTTKTFATIWGSSGKGRRLPGLSRVSTYSNAAAMSVEKTSPGIRTLTVVGSSGNANGVRQACEWTITIRSGHMHISAPLALASSDFPGPSTATAVNASGWVVGKLWLTTGTNISSGGFLWESSIGMMNLQSLLPSKTFWKIVGVGGINAGGQIVGQAQPAHGAATSRGILLTPEPGTASDS